MGKSSGKGRKARWRNIDTSEVGAQVWLPLYREQWFLHRKSSEASTMMVQIETAAAHKSTVRRQGKDLEALPDENLFFIDKVPAAL